MTRGLRQVPLAAEPGDVAARVVRHLQHGPETVWVPPVLRAVMAVVRHLPGQVFRRLPW
ncbi:hypothetical protein [Georgenia sp. SUBG003]|uniref:hypothetical protein n=1 Tax=Georgenia sp. SUBG003 TaxID=1497974 RepID=UPI003AB65C84